MRVALVSCVKSKAPAPRPARDLYTSPLFRGLRAYAETHADAWYILSARYGLLDPNQVIGPYELTLNSMSAAARAMWADGVKARLAEVLPAGAEVILLAGERYRENLLPFLRERHHPVSVPLQGLSFGQQLRYLNEALSPDGNPGSGGWSKPTRRGGSRIGAGRGFGRGRTLADLTSPRAVLDAIAECQRLGRDAFLEKYGYGPAHRYFLVHDSQRYDSKAIAGVAYGYQFPERGALESGEFSGGANTVQRKLEELGFTMTVL